MTVLERDLAPPLSAPLQAVHELTLQSIRTEGKVIYQLHFIDSTICLQTEKRLVRTNSEAYMQVPLRDLHVFLCRDQSFRTVEFRTSLGTSVLHSQST